MEEDVPEKQDSLYLRQFRQRCQDPLRLIPFANVQTFPLSGNESLLGWTYRHKNGTVYLREDLESEKKLETLVHECIHTPDEYETRRLTEWIMEGMREKEEKYPKGPLSYLF